MSDNLGMATQLAGQSLRFGWYFALNRALDWRTDQLGRTNQTPRYQPVRPVPSLQDLLAERAQLLMSDALNVRDGLYPPMDDDAASLPGHLARVRQMFADIPQAYARRAGKDATTAKREPGAAAVPDYYAQDFHFQTGGYLTEESARLYDVQVETLFMGAAGPMRRAALAPVAHFMAGRDQRQVTLLDVACGTGRFLRQVRLAFPALRLKGLDLSRPYLDEARRQLEGLRAAELIEAAAEKMPLDSASVDVATSIFLFHELPPDVRRTVTAEIARVLKPGGMLVFLDSLQMGDRPTWDGLIEAFPERFHEPYYRHYAVDDLEGLFSAAGLEPELTTTPFLSKLMVRRKR
ncbi:MAG TPA: class I SAM-dependent methyltransferase [Hyphomicrobiaceae bacterium]|jgi:ubiquinone/menaquinone biosynthesis C-methylase UbiE|nr:class I SAM-dependent methyltransferase [Hyphomicrobiaceae bacterium]